MPLIIGLILGPMFERELRLACIQAGGSFAEFRFQPHRARVFGPDGPFLWRSPCERARSSERANYTIQSRELHMFKVVCVGAFHREGDQTAGIPAGSGDLTKC